MHLGPIYFTLVDKIGDNDVDEFGLVQDFPVLSITVILPGLANVVFALAGFADGP